MLTIVISSPPLYRSERTCHSTLIWFTDYTQVDVLAVLRHVSNTFPNLGESLRNIKLVILQVWRERRVLFSKFK